MFVNDLTRLLWGWGWWQGRVFCVYKMAHFAGLDTPLLTCLPSTTQTSKSLLAIPGRTHQAAISFPNLWGMRVLHWGKQGRKGTRGHWVSGQGKGHTKHGSRKASVSTFAFGYPEGHRGWRGLPPGTARQLLPSSLTQHGSSSSPRRLCAFDFCLSAVSCLGWVRLARQAGAVAGHMI